MQSVVNARVIGSSSCPSIPCALPRENCARVAEDWRSCAPNLTFKTNTNIQHSAGGKYGDEFCPNRK